MKGMNALVRISPEIVPWLLGYARDQETEKAVREASREGCPFRKAEKIAKDLGVPFGYLFLTSPLKENPPESGEAAFARFLTETGSEQEKLRRIQQEAGVTSPQAEKILSWVAAAHEIGKEE